MRILGVGRSPKQCSSHPCEPKALVITIMLGLAFGGGHAAPVLAQPTKTEAEAAARANAEAAADDKADAAPDDGGQDRVVAIDKEDAEMTAAMAGARASMDVFLELFSKNLQSLPLVKVAIPHDTGLEHMWMILTDISAEGVVGELRNDGVHVGFHAGDSYWAGHDQVSDWMVLYPPYDSGPIYGAFTTRVALARDPDAAPKGVAKRLQPLPELKGP